MSDGTQVPECFQRREGATDDGYSARNGTESWNVLERLGWLRGWINAKVSEGTQVPECFQRWEGATDDGYDGYGARNGTVDNHPSLEKGPGADDVGGFAAVTPALGGWGDPSTTSTDKFKCEILYIY